ncbi:DUF6456 domain-containing protein [Parvibaculum sp.]|uniref:DUF6456 domain-containing protein n=1 Tax=Parvibaculum sp. TaxID=2024848 RepID=UPI002C3BD134|nr:DUF6456 domain-containing protein [Parvibaculum sp.]HUD52598.1 DUF6456 domain-containing protein [Parvibaculum sp.]
MMARDRMAAREKAADHLAEREIEREVRRIFPRLSERGAHAARFGDGAFGIFVARNRWRAPVLTIEPPLWAAIERRDFVEPAGEGAWRPSAVGIAYWRRLDALAEPFRAQHQLVASRRIGAGDGSVAVEINEGEAPLGWLRRRKGPDGQPLVSAPQFEAGERLRRDFTLACMTPRVTTDWSLALTADGGRRGPRDPADVSDRALAARARLARALHEVGPRLSDVLLAVICHLQGLEEAEQTFGWPRRSGKLVLQIALDRLAAHYGLNEGGAGHPRERKRE